MADVSDIDLKALIARWEGDPTLLGFRDAVLSCLTELQARRAAEAKAVEALREIRTELEQANGGKGPNLPLSQHILQIARAALGARDD